MAAPAQPPFGTAQALSLGAQQAVSLWPAALGLFLCGAAEVLAGLVAVLGALEWATDSANVGLAALGGAVVVWLAARVLRALVEGGALRQGAARMQRRGFLPLAAEAVSAAPRTLSFLAWSLPLELLYAAGAGLAMLTASAAYFGALGAKHGGFLSSASLALLLTLWAPAAVAWALWGPVAFVRAVRRDEGVLVSLYDAAGELWRRPWQRLAVLVVTGAAAAVAELVLGGMVSVFSAPSLPSTVAGQLVSGLLAAYVAGLVGLCRLQAFLALGLNDDGVLPAPILTAELVVDAVPVSPAPG
jgi:hypothetical protein